MRPWPETVMACHNHVPITPQFAAFEFHARVLCPKERANRVGLLVRTDLKGVVRGCRTQRVANRVLTRVAICPTVDEHGCSAQGD